VVETLQPYQSYSTISPFVLIRGWNFDALSAVSILSFSPRICGVMESINNQKSTIINRQSLPRPEIG
jgi:hypothetical protein